MKHLLKISDLSTKEIINLLESAKKLKQQQQKNTLPSFSGKTFALLFEKPSLRTRAAFESAAADLHISPIIFRENEVFLAGDGTERESLSDILKNLEGFCDVLLARVHSHSTLQKMAENAKIPIINGLCDAHHPTQALCDIFSISKYFGDLKDKKIAYVGDGNNVAQSLLEICKKLDIEFVSASPVGYGLKNALENPAEAVKNADVIYTDTWVSMGDEADRAMREKVFVPYQVNTALMKKAKKDAVFMHCLPAHRGQEVSAKIIDGPQSIVFSQAHARRDIARALLFQMLS